MPLLADSSVPGSTWNVLSPGFHASTTPVLRCANASSNVLPGRISTVATSEPSVNAATLLSAMLSGVTTQPTHVAVGAAPLVSSSKTSTDSRPPWFVA